MWDVPAILNSFLKTVRVVQLIGYASKNLADYLGPMTALSSVNTSLVSCGFSFFPTDFQMNFSYHYFSIVRFLITSYQKQGLEKPRFA